MLSHVSAADHIVTILVSEDQIHVGKVWMTCQKDGLFRDTMLLLRHITHCPRLCQSLYAILCQLNTEHPLCLLDALDCQIACQCHSAKSHAAA